MSDGIAVAFFSTGGLFGFDCALRFAGENGRLLTMPDLCALRARADLGDPSWGRYFTSASSEFFGLSAGGVPVVVVLHGGGPLMDRNIFSRSLSAGGRIERVHFLRVLHGHYGPVEVVDLSSVTDAFQYPFTARHAEEILSSPLWVARLGGLDAASGYVSRHAVISIAVREENGRSADGHAGPIMKMSEPDPGYTTIVDNPGGGLRYAPKDIDADYAVGHFLNLGAPVRTGLSGGMTGFISEIDLICGERGASNFVASDGPVVTGIRNVPRASSVYGRLGDRILVARDAEADADTFYALTTMGNKAFTQSPFEAGGLASGVPEMPVLSMEEMGTAVFSQEPLGYYGFFKYDPADIKALSPEGANAYELGEPAFDGSRQSVSVRFFRVGSTQGRGFRPTRRSCPIPSWRGKPSVRALPAVARGL